MSYEHYETILSVLAKKIKEQETQIGYLEWKCDDLQKKLEDSEGKKEV